MDGLMVGLSCLIVIVGVSIFGYFSLRALRNNLRGRGEHKRLAEEGGYQLLIDGDQDIQNVYGGESNGRPFAYRLIQDTHRTHNTDGPRNVRVLKMQVIVPLQETKFSDFRMTLRKKRDGIPDTFEEIWLTVPQTGVLTGAAQQAIYNFAAGNPLPAGTMSGDRLASLGPKVRKLSIIDRAAWGSNMPDPLFNEAVSLMTYDHHEAIFEPDAFQTLVDELTSLANQIDS